MNSQSKLITLWGLTIIGMILHFNYHVGQIFYGIDVVRPDATGEETTGVFIIRTAFYHLPIIWILVLLYVKKQWVKWGMFVISSVYALAHASHLFGELTSKETNPSQLSLLTVVFIVAGILAVEHFRYAKAEK